MAVRKKGWLRSLVRDVVVMFSAMRDPRVPWSAKLVGVISVLYVILPVDLIPDFIPVIGWLDDMAALPLASYLFQRLTAAPVMDELRTRADSRLSWLTPRVFLIGGVILAIWLVLASWAGWRMWQGRRAAAPNASSAPTRHGDGETPAAPASGSRW